MTSGRVGAARRIVVPVLVSLLAASSLSAQLRPVAPPTTLRYGSGHLDVPSALVLPHLTVVGGLSGFSVPDGTPDPLEGWVWDGSLTLGLFHRAEVGLTLQSFAPPEDGGSVVGVHGRWALLRPRPHGVGLALGARWVGRPEFAGAERSDHQPSRLGVADIRLVEAPDAGADVRTGFTPYVVGSWALPGVDGRLLPAHDWTFSLGWGGGQFRDGGDLPFYAFVDSDGVFAAVTLHMRAGRGRALHLTGEWNGFDVNVGAELDLGGARVGGFLLGANHGRAQSVFRSRKWGVRMALALCPQELNLCKPELLQRVQPDTVVLPAPPPDTVLVERTDPVPTATPLDLCLATGSTVRVHLTPDGDTLVGPDRVSLRTSGAGVALAGRYAGGLDWYDSGEDLTFDARTYLPTGSSSALDCAGLVQVGTRDGVPIMVGRNAAPPYDSLWVPERPGLWRRYVRPDAPPRKERP